MTALLEERGPDRFALGEKRVVQKSSATEKREEHKVPKLSLVGRAVGEEGHPPCKLLHKAKEIFTLHGRCE